MDQAEHDRAKQIQAAHREPGLDQVGALADVLGEIDRGESGKQADEQEDEIPVDEQRSEHADLHHGKEPDARAQQQRDQERREGAGAEKIETAPCCRDRGRASRDKAP